MSDNNSSVEASNPVLGSLKVSGANVNNILTTFSFLGIAFLSWIAWNHNVDAKDNEKGVVIVLKESNKAQTEALKSSNEATNKILEKMNDTQQRTVEALREANCLLALPQDRRTNASEFCKRIAR